MKDSAPAGTQSPGGGLSAVGGGGRPAAGPSIRSSGGGTEPPDHDEWVSKCAANIHAHPLHKTAFRAPIQNVQSCTVLRI